MPSVCVTIDFGRVYCGFCTEVNFNGTDYECGIYGTLLNRKVDGFERCHKCLLGEKLFNKLRKGYEESIRNQG